MVRTLTDWGGLGCFGLATESTESTEGLFVGTRVGSECPSLFRYKDFKINGLIVRVLNAQYFGKDAVKLTLCPLCSLWLKRFRFGKKACCVLRCR